MVKWQLIFTWNCDNIKILSYNKFLKWNLSRYKFKLFLGGLKTYCLVVLILAFIKSRNLEDKNDIVYTMEELLKFYGYEFD